MSVRTSLIAEAALIAFVCSLDVKPPMVMISPPFVTSGCDQAIGPAIWRFFKIVRVLQ